MAMTRILSIDGGGIRGIIPAMVLAAIEKSTGRPIASLFDVIAGTSTGGILACGLTAPGDGGGPKFAASALADMYVNDGPAIFPHHLLSGLTSLVDEKYSQDGIEGVLRRYVGDARLSDVLTRVLVTAYDIERRKPFFFRSQDAVKGAASDHLLWMVARSTSAAPTYFEPFKLPGEKPSDDHALVDGGVYANNPAMCAYVDRTTGQARVDEVFMVSLGTGSLNRPIAYNDARKWGKLQWAQPILSVVFDGVSSTTDYQLRQVLPADAYFRLETDLDVASDNLDDVTPENLRNLQLQAEKLIAERDADLATICTRLTAASPAA